MSEASAGPALGHPDIATSPVGIPFLKPVPGNIPGIPPTRVVSKIFGRGGLQIEGGKFFTHPKYRCAELQEKDKSFFGHNIYFRRLAFFGWTVGDD